MPVWLPYPDRPRRAWPLASPGGRGRRKPRLSRLFGVLAVGLALSNATTAHAQSNTPAKTHAQGPAGGAWSAEVQTRPLAAPRARVTAIDISGDGARTLVRLVVDRPITASMFTLDEPYRAIVDVADLDFHLQKGRSSRTAGLVKDYRYGQFEAGRSRLVIDLNGPASITNAAFTAPAPGRSGQLTFELVRVAAADFQGFRGTSGPAAAASPGAAAQQLRTGRHDEGQKKSGTKTANARPVVVIDPGHGGIDPGTVAGGGLAEKAVTLAVAQQVRALLLHSRRVDVVLTRERDTFVSLDQRVEISRRHTADLFVSIHADSLAEKELAQSIRGATVYILSDNASDDRSRRVAEKENAADILAGLAAVPSSAEDQVRNILLDLVQRETANFSVTFRNLLLGNMRGRIPLAKDPQRAAAFKVLRQSEVPSVLVELGYMSNPEDLARLGKAEGQKQLASAIAASIEAYFANRDSQLKR